MRFGEGIGFGIDPKRVLSFKATRMRFSFSSASIPPSDAKEELRIRLKRLKDSQEHAQEMLRQARDAIGSVPLRTASKETRRDVSRGVEARAAMAKKLSAANGYARHLERSMKEKEKALLRAKQCTHSCAAAAARCSTQLQELRERVERGDVETALARMKELQERLELLRRDLGTQEVEVDLVRVRTVPVEWHGMAEDVCVMGSFDNWTRGVHMSPEYAGSHNSFHGELLLTPGRYEVKFLVDGTWQLAPHWPATQDDPLLGNNILVVE